MLQLLKKMISKDTNFLLLILWVTWQCPGINAALLQSINVAGNIIPEQSKGLDLACKIVDFQRFDNVSIFKSASKELSDSNEPVAECTRSECTVSGEERYTYTSDSSGVYIHIAGIVRAMDQAWWHCTLDGQMKSLELTIYTTPTTIESHLAHYGSHDLSRDPVTIVCRTSCIYPEANMDWYYSKPDGSQHNYPYTTSTTFEVCDDWEKRQLVTLTLPVNTTLSDNFEQSVQFRCGISVFPGLSKPVYSDYFEGIVFAVTVDSVILFDEGKLVHPLSKITTFDEREKTLECRPGTARPAPVIVWYMGGSVVQRSNATTLSLIAKPSDNAKTVGCRAYNLQTEQSAVISYQGILSVIERPDPPSIFWFSKITSSSVTIAWTPAHGGEMTQTIHLQYKKNTDVNWTTEMIDSPSAQSYVINRLSPGILYEVQLYTSNIIGDSKATQPKFFATLCTAREYPRVPAWAWVFLSLFIIETILMITCAIRVVRVWNGGYVNVPSMWKLC